jgi:hypothetical protein
MSEYDLTIKKPEDWAKLDKRNLGVIVDPFICVCAGSRMIVL